MAGEVTEERFFKLAELPDVALVDGVTARFVNGVRMMFSFVRLAPGKEVPLHSHPHEQLGHIIEGSLLMTIAGEEREIGPGDAYVIPGGVLHKAIGGPQGGLALDVFVPVREDYVELARQQAQRGTS
jgi:quercetin dioxygenase-like cupin family protein